MAKLSHSGLIPNFRFYRWAHTRPGSARSCRMSGFDRSSGQPSSKPLYDSLTRQDLPRHMWGCARSMTVAFARYGGCTG